jgi:hypothetical protein
MSIKSSIGAGAVLLLLAAVSPAYGQHDPQEDKGQKAAPQAAAPATRSLHQAAPQAGAPATRGLQPAAPAKPTARPTATAQRNQPAYGGAYHGGVKPTATPTFGGVHASGVPQAQSQVRSGFLQSRATSWATQHRTWQQRGGYNGYRVPDDRFSLYFGSGHFFDIGSLPLLFVGGYPRFQYDGYWVTLMDPWPEDWPPLWYETDNVYIDWGGDGYYLYDTNYPGIGIAVMISF